MSQKYEFGWNDPPSYSYSSSQAATEKQSTHLSKRPHLPPPPITDPQPQPDDSRSTQPPAPILSGPPTGTIGTGGESSEKISPKPTEIEQDLCVGDQADFAEVTQKLDLLTDGLQDKLQKRIYEDIKRRLDLLSQQANDKKISRAVKLKMGQLVAAIEETDYDRADTIHVGLMVDHVSEVSQWLVGIKKLIATLKSEQ